MRHTLGVLFLYICYIFLLGGCHVGSKSNVHESLSLTQAALKASAPKPPEDKNLETEEPFTTDRQGGQPSDISLTGAIVVNESKWLDGLDNRIFIDISTGKGINGKVPILRANIEIQEEFIPATGIQAREVRGRYAGKYINIGCDLEKFVLSGLKEIPIPVVINPGLVTVQIMSAERIFICDATLIKGDLVNIVAKQVFLSGAKFSFANKGQLIIIAEELVLEGRNSVHLSAKDAEITKYAAPDFTLHTKTLFGSGQLNIVSKGSNYKKPFAIF